VRVTVRGVVVVGDRRGRELGFPTANVRPEPGTALPPHGIYAGRMLDRDAAVSIGVRPTFGDGLEPLVEAHLLDYEGDLYGREVELELVSRLRDELRFDSVDALCAQIAADVAAVREVLA
jgi:riboflavin kinase / FMN adenylyltransferase